MRLTSICGVGVVLAATFGAGSAHAQYRPPVINVNSEFGLAAEGFLQNYGETEGSRTLDSEHGAIPGAQIKATTMFDALGLTNLYAGFRYQFDHGNVAYDGAYLNGTPYRGPSHYAVNDFGGEFGKGFLLANNVLITPIIEGGWHGWKRDLGGGQIENYAHGYVGGGVRGDLGITERLVLTGKLAVAETIDPNMTAPAAPRLGLPQMSFNLGMAPLYQASVGADYKFYTVMHLYGGVDFTHFSYGASAVNNIGFLEPSSISNEVTFHLGIAVGL